MDTISRENNSSYLPVAGILVGVLALLLGGIALVKVSSLGKRVPENLPDTLASLDSASRGAAQSADKAAKGIDLLRSSTQAAFDSIGPEIGNLKASITKLEEAAKARVAPPKATKGGGAVAAGPGEYVVKPGDTGTSISKATGVSLSDLETLNPGINWNRLGVGKKIKTK